MNHLRKKPPIIIGAGVGGLSIGALLENHGYNVQIFEKSDDGSFYMIMCMIMV